jgi:hypothetical protein
MVCEVRGGGKGLPGLTGMVPPVGTNEFRLRKKSVFKRDKEAVIQDLS